MNMNDGLLETWRLELAEYYTTMRKFKEMDPTEVYGSLSAFSARASEMRLALVDHPTKRMDAFRTRVIDKFLEECDRQFKFISRITAVHEMEVKLAGGRFT